MLSCCHMVYDFNQSLLFRLGTLKKSNILYHNVTIFNQSTTIVGIGKSKSKLIYRVYLVYRWCSPVKPKLGPHCLLTKIISSLSILLHIQIGLLGLHHIHLKMPPKTYFRALETVRSSKNPYTSLHCLSTSNQSTPQMLLVILIEDNACYHMI